MEEEKVEQTKFADGFLEACEETEGVEVITPKESEENEVHAKTNDAE